jgi:hypothetical protein
MNKPGKKTSFIRQWWFANQETLNIPYSSRGIVPNAVVQAAKFRKR